jgi:type III secretion protein T
VSPTDILPSFAGIYQYLVAASLAFARISGVMLVMPAFTRIGVTGILRNGIGLALTLPLVPMMAVTLASEQLTVATIAALVLKELAVGIIVGLVLGVPLWAAEAAGSILDLQRGATMATLVDPDASEETSVTGTVLVLAMVALYYGSGGLSITLRTLYESYGIWPIARFLPLFSADAGALLVGLLDDVLSMGLMLVVPIVICLFLADIVLALVSRAAPHLNVFALSLAVKSLIFAVLLVLYGGFLASYMAGDIASLLGSTARLETIGNVKGQGR